MNANRIFKSAEYFQPVDGEPIRSVVTESIDAIAAGDVVIAPRGCIHGVVNNGDEPLTFISIVSPADAGYQLASP
jgi:oxalate decarboxylase/phosphoglucose isomerase-like protein (cupin superfamily)